MTMCVNFVKIRLVVFDFYAVGQSQVSQSLATEINKIDNNIDYYNLVYRVYKITSNIEYYLS